MLLSNHDVSPIRSTISHDKHFQRETLATKLLDIGKSLLRSCYQDSKSASEETKANEAIRWMQKAFSVIEPLDCATNLELAELKVSIFEYTNRSSFKNLVRDRFSGVWVSEPGFILWYNGAQIGPLLARGYFLSSSQDPENLIRAETALEEVIATIDPSAHNVSTVLATG